jgi:hypothetical protein
MLTEILFKLLKFFLVERRGDVFTFESSLEPPNSSNSLDSFGNYVATTPFGLIPVTTVF